MRVVIDTNVFVSSFLGSGYPRKIIELWKAGKITICLSQDIVDEYVGFFLSVGLNRAEVDEILQLFAQGFHAFFVATTPNLKIVASDPDDDKFFECAVATKAEYVVTSDKAVAEIRRYMAIRVISPKKLVQEIA